MRRFLILTIAATALAGATGCTPSGLAPKDAPADVDAADDTETGDAPETVSDDLEPDVCPDGACPEVDACFDGRDNDADGLVDCWDDECAEACDADGDGQLPLPMGFDCDDGNAFIHADANEDCDGYDNDCDGLVDDEDPDRAADTTQLWFVDADEDGFGSALTWVRACAAPEGHVGNADDCNDFDALVRPNGWEVCDQLDNDCNGLTDEDDANLDPSTLGEWFTDGDGDGLGDPGTGQVLCIQPPNTVDNPDDCDDTSALVTAPVAWLADNDGDGFGGGSASPPLCSAPAPTWVIDDGGLDCDDSDVSVHPGAADLCADGLDSNCDGALEVPYYLDLDGDSFGDPAMPLQWCDTIPFDYVADDSDCDDTSPFANPMATEICNGVDDDCDGALPADEEDGDLDGLSTCQGDPDDTDPNVFVDTFEVGDETDNWSGTDRLRGNQFAPVDPGTLHSFGLLLDLPFTCTLDYFVYEAPTADGPWTVAWFDQAAHGPGKDYHLSPPANLSYSPGSVYALAVAWNACDADYYRGDGTDMGVEHPMGELVEYISSTYYSSDPTHTYGLGSNDFGAYAMEITVSGP